MASFSGSISTFVTAEAEAALKPLGLCELIEKELGLDLYEVKPKDAIELINAKLAPSVSSTTL